jgi:hypothetical protein
MVGEWGEGTDWLRRTLGTAVVAILYMEGFKWRRHGRYGGFGRHGGSVVTRLTVVLQSWV